MAQGKEARSFGLRDKYFQIGFHKCGTTSIHRFFHRSGIPSVHYDKGRLGRTMQRNLQVGRFLLAGYEQYDAFAGMSFTTPTERFDAAEHYERLLEHIPNAKFILNTRDRDSWLRSRLAMRNGAFAEDYKSVYGLPSTDAMLDHWKKEWDARHAEVRKRIPPQQLLVFNIEQDSAQRLCEFAGLDSAMAKHWKRENASMNAIGDFLAQWMPQPVLAALPSDFNGRVRRLLRKRRVKIGSRRRQ